MKRFSISPLVVPETKEQLYKDAANYRLVIDQQINNLKGNIIRTSTRTLVIGTALLGTYLIVQWFTSSETQSKKTKDSITPKASSNLPLVVKKSKKESWLITSIKGYMLAFVIALAKDKIKEALMLLQDENASKKNSK